MAPASTSTAACVSNVAGEVEVAKAPQLRARLVPKNFHLSFEHMYEALNVIK